MTQLFRHNHVICLLREDNNCIITFVFEYKADLKTIRKDLGLEEVGIDVVFRGIPESVSLFGVSNTNATKLGDRKWIIQLSEGYRNRDALEHESYHVYAGENKKFPFYDKRLLRILLFIDYYEQWRANQYALHGRK